MENYNYTQADIECMQQYVNDYSDDELLTTDVDEFPEDFIEFFMIGKEIADYMSEDDWTEFTTLKTDEAVTDFIQTRYENVKKTDASEKLWPKAVFLVDMGITSVAYDKGIFPIDDDDWE